MIKHIQINVIDNGFTVSYALVDKNYENKTYFFPTINYVISHLKELDYGKQ